MSIIANNAGTRAQFPDGAEFTALGSVTSPMLRFNNGAQTGFYSTGTDAWAFASNGVQTWGVSAAGAHTIGPASGATGQHVIRGDGTANYTLQIQATNAGAASAQSNGLAILAGLTSADTPFAVANRAGNVGFGSCNGVGAWTLGASTSTMHILQGNSGVAARVQSHVASASITGRVLDLKYVVDTDCTGGYFLTMLNSSDSIIGSITATSNSATTFTGSSDSRLKQDAKDFDGLPMVMQMQPRDYEWKSNPGNRQKGFFAQELHTILPDAVTVGSDELTEDGSLARPWGIDYGRLSPVLVKAIQEQQAIIQALEARIAALEGGV